MILGRIIFWCKLAYTLFLLIQHLFFPREIQCKTDEKSVNPQSPVQQKQAVFTDTAVFKLNIQGNYFGTGTCLLDEKGNYKSRFVMSYAGQTIEFSMLVNPDETGEWQSMEISSPAGKIIVKHEDNQAKYTVNGKDKAITLPEDYILYDDYGVVFESVMFERYDMTKKGRQIFKRYRIPENTQMPGQTLDIEIEYLREEIKTVKGKLWQFMVFSYRVYGINTEYWIGQDFKVYMTKVPIQNTTSIREGFDELLKTEEEDPLLSKPEYSFRKETVMVPMRDGINLSTDIYFSESDQNKFPVILVRTPYKKEMEELKGTYFSKRGYIVAVQDVRGRFASEGTWEPFVNEVEDGYDSIEWLAEQEWCNGKIGMIGGSYVGWVQFWAAVQKPPHLVTIIPSVVPPDPFYNIPYEYGTFFITGSMVWAEVIETEATADLTGVLHSRILDKNFEEVFDFLPVIDLDKRILGRENSYWRKWIEHNVNDSYWDRANYLEKLKDIDIPVFLQSGWFDGDGIGSKLAYSALKKSGNKRVKLILGPWEHTDQATSIVRGHDVGEEALIDLQTLYLRWFDYWLKGIENGIMEEPLVQLYVINSKKWLKANTYPLPQTEFTKFYLNSSEGANTLNGDGILLTEISQSGKEYDEYTYDPGDPTPAPAIRARKGGRKGYEEITGSRQDILYYQTEPLEESLTITGPVSAVIYASSSAVDTDWFVTMQLNVADGSIVPLMKGVIRARFRNSSKEPELLEKNKIYEYSIDLWQTGITCEKGDRITIEITSAYFPAFSRNLNTGGHNEMETDFVKAEQKIYHSKDHPSHLLLPIVKLENR